MCLCKRKRAIGKWSNLIHTCVDAKYFCKVCKFMQQNSWFWLFDDIRTFLRELEQGVFHVINVLSIIDTDIEYNGNTAGNSIATTSSMIGDLCLNECIVWNNNKSFITIEYLSRKNTNGDNRTPRPINRNPVANFERSVDGK